MIFEENDKGIYLRVRLSPNVGVSGIKGIYTDEKGLQYLKIGVVSPPEKGKANKELIKFLAKSLGLAKSEIELVSGEISHYKKLLLKNDSQFVKEQIAEWNRENVDDGSNN